MNPDFGSGPLSFLLLELGPRLHGSSGSPYPYTCLVTLPYDSRPSAVLVLRFEKTEVSGPYREMDFKYRRAESLRRPEVVWKKGPLMYSGSLLPERVPQSPYLKSTLPFNRFDPEVS